MQFGAALRFQFSAVRSVRAFIISSRRPVYVKKGRIRPSVPLSSKTDDAPPALTIADADLAKGIEVLIDVLRKQLA